MDVQTRLFRLSLWLTQGVGCKTFHHVLQHFSDFESLSKASLNDFIALGIREQTALLLSKLDQQKAQQHLVWSEHEENHIVFWDSPQYPSLLSEIHQPPPVLFVRGQLACISQTPFAVVGSRNPTPRGAENAREFSYDLARNGLVVTSGLALGIDAASHMGALDAKAPTIAVLGTGIDILYPRQHEFLSEQIIANGALISEFPLRTAPLPQHFPRRNRIISGLSVGTLVVEAALRSGSLITAKDALEQGREVFAIPGSIHNPLARGCHALIRNGAKLVESTQDILDEIWTLRQTITPPAPKKGTHDGNILANLDMDHSKLVECVGFEATAVDLVISRSGLTPESVLPKLVELELLGAISQVPGGYLRKS